MKKIFFSTFILLSFFVLTNCSSNKSSNKSNNEIKTLEVYSIRTKHPSGNIYSLSNKVIFTKNIIQNGKILEQEDISTLGTFTSSDEYEIYYSNKNAPKSGHDRYAFYKNTKYKGLSEKYMYASDSIKNITSKIESDSKKGACQHYADNFDGGNLENSDNFWVEFCPTDDLAIHIKNIIKREQ